MIKIRTLFFCLSIVLFSGILSAQSLEDKIKDYIIKNPEVILKSLENYEKKKEENDKIKNKKNVEFNKSQLLDSSNGLFSGNKDGQKILVEFFDYNCTYCKKAHKDIKKLISNDENIKVIYKNFPILSEESLKLSKIAIFLGKKSNLDFKKFHNEIIEHKGFVSDKKLKMIIRNIGYDPDLLFSELNKDYLVNEVKKDVELAKILNLRGTPVFIANNELVFGYVGFDELNTMLNIQQ